MINKLIPRAIKSWSKNRIREIASEGTIKYIPYERGNEWYMIPEHPRPDSEICDSGLAIPPCDLWLGYANSKDEYLASGNTT